MTTPVDIFQTAYEASTAGHRFLQQHAIEIPVAIWHGVHMRAILPLDALRWCAERFAINGVRNVVIGSKPPAVTVAATVKLLGSDVRLSSAIQVEDLALDPSSIQVSLRLSDFTADALDSDSAIGKFLKSTKLDLTKPANLLNMSPVKPKFISKAKDDCVTLSFGLRGLPISVQKVIAVFSSMIKIPKVYTKGDWLMASWRPKFW